MSQHFSEYIGSTGKYFTSTYLAFYMIPQILETHHRQDNGEEKTQKDK